VLNRLSHPGTPRRSIFQTKEVLLGEKDELLYLAEKLLKKPTVKAESSSTMGRVIT